jgi:AcrR family transcriptional regulator
MPMKTRSPRRDAQARREALISAAADCFAEFGYRVPLEEVAERAGVGRTTLYRNFKDRQALALAIFDREVDRIAAILDPAAPIDRTMAQLIRSGAKASALFARISSELALDKENLAAFQALGARLAGLLLPTVTAAKARGELREDVRPEQLVTATRMIGALLRPHLSTAEAEDQIAGGLDMLFRGLRPR